MDKFAYYIKNELERIGYVAQSIGEKPAGVTVEFKTLTGSDHFFVVYIRQAIQDPELIRQVFTFHNIPILFVVDSEQVEAHIQNYTVNGKAPPLWLRALHAIYYGRIYTWFAYKREIQALHFDWDKKIAVFSEPISIDRVILTETDSLLRDYPGHFKIARFSDRAFWKGERPQKPPKRDSKKSSPNEGFWKEEWNRWSERVNNTSWDTKPPPHTAESIYEMFERLKREEMRRRQSQQQQTYNPRPPRYTPSGDEWFTRLMGGGDLAGAKKIYKALARQYHPDVNKDPTALEIMQKINAAYDRVKEILV